MTTIAADMLRGPLGSLFDLYSAPVRYERNGMPFIIKVAMRDFRGDNLFGSAAIGDRLGIARFVDFDALGIGQPQRYDRLEGSDGLFTIVDWRVAPPVGTPVFYRLALRGGGK